MTGAKFQAGALLLLAGVLAPLPALAAPATASQNLNVRSGPSTSYDIIAQLQQGDTVDVRQCEGVFCQISYNGKSGWVSAGYLTRDPVVKPPVSQIIASTDSPVAPQIGGGTPKIYNPGPAPSTLPPGALPPAYEDTSADDANTDNQDGADGPRSSVTLPSDSGDVIASAGDPPPRPHADIPNVGPGPGDEDANAPDDDNGPSGAPPSGFAINSPPGGWNDQPGVGWRDHYGRLGWRGRFAEPDTAAALRACFFAGPEADGQGFCLRPGQHVSELGDWGTHIVSLRNPTGLRVTVCTDTGRCHVYGASGPVMADAGISSITVDAD